MCSIIGGSSEEKVKSLVQLNRSRGTHSHSIFIIDRNNYKLISRRKSLGELDPDKIKIPSNGFAIIHQQAPTSDGKDERFIHPSEIHNDKISSYVWHNGIIKQKHLQKMRHFAVNMELSGWDTHLIHSKYYRYYDLNDIDGSMAIVIYYENQTLSLARNEISPLFYDEDSFSSVKFDGATSLPPNRVFDIHFKNNKMDLHPIDILEFQTVETPYFLG